MGQSENMARLFYICVTLLLARGCHGYRFFQDRIPNGKFVPHPCKVGFNWEGVGHEQDQGAGKRNVFGRDFMANGKKWDRTICLMDSDGDGLTNGQELGDPDCVWEIGQQPARKKELSHPGSIGTYMYIDGLMPKGICDPWNSVECKDRTGFVSCDSNKLDCPAISEPGTINITYTMPANTAVPARETIYKCVVFDYPRDADYHMVANVPALDNLDVMHHILVFGCENEATAHAPGEPFDCEMEVDPSCKSIIGVWSFGMNGECAHPDMGFRIGKNGYKRGVLQLHWNNPEERADYVDSSGITLYLTEKLRPNNAGILMVGQDYLVIPPGEEKVTFTGVCSSECSKSLIKDDVKLPVAFNHMHGLGIQQKVELIRDGRKLQDITYDPVYDYDSPELHIYPTPLTIKPGDEIRTECVFKSTSRTKTTFYGDGTFDEMCYSFLTYYPKENIPDAWCSAWQDVTQCAFNISDEIHGCRFKKLHDLTDPATRATYDLVMSHCSPHIGCRKECLPIARKIKQTSCYRKGTVDDWARMKIDQHATDVKNMTKFYAALDSCDILLALEEAETNKQCPDQPTNVAPYMVRAWAWFLLAAAVILPVVAL